MFIVVWDCLCRTISENRQTIDPPQNVFDFVDYQFGFCTLGLVGHGPALLIDNYRMALRRENALQRLRSDLLIGVLRLRMNAFQALMLRSG
jgi:hypothetical protein